MNYWNTLLILIGTENIICTTIRYLIKHKTNFCSEKYFNKLESRYENIARKRTVKLEILYHYLIDLEYIIMGLLIKSSDAVMIAVILVSVITLVSYYLIRNKYITI
ncbi:TPA: hypothetical protein ACKOR7_003924 [Clostridioides difficile]|nr:hypothetical protein IM33_08205 [Clostridioides difficile]